MTIIVSEYIESETRQGHGRARTHDITYYVITLGDFIVRTFKCNPARDEYLNRDLVKREVNTFAFDLSRVTDNQEVIHLSYKMELTTREDWVLQE